MVVFCQWEVQDWIWQIIVKWSDYNWWKYQNLVLRKDLNTLIGVKIKFREYMNKSKFPISQAAEANTFMKVDILVNEFDSHGLFSLVPIFSQDSFQSFYLMV